MTSPLSLLGFLGFLYDAAWVLPPTLFPLLRDVHSGVSWTQSRPVFMHSPTVLSLSPKPLLPTSSCSLAPRTFSTFYPPTVSKKNITLQKREKSEIGSQVRRALQSQVGVHQGEKESNWTCSCRHRPGPVQSP